MVVESLARRAVAKVKVAQVEAVEARVGALVTEEGKVVVKQREYVSEYSVYCALLAPRAHYWRTCRDLERASATLATTRWSRGTLGCQRPPGHFEHG